jgi:RHS repeat-associated protein
MQYERRRDGPLIDYVKDERGLITRTERDAFRNVVRLTHADGFSQSWKYHPSYNFVSESIDALGRIARYQYSDAGNLTEAIETVGTPQQRRTVYSYDQYGQLKTSTLKGAAAANDVVMEYFYDNYGNRTKMIDAETHATQYRDFDVMGRAQTIEDANGAVQKLRYNAAGWMLGSESALGFKSELTYDKVGSRKTSEVLLEGNQRAVSTYRYDDLDRLIETEDPLSGISKQRYDAEGKMLESEDARQVKTSMEYDARARLVKLIDGNSNETETIYGDASNALEGLVAARKFPTYQENYLYDERDRQIQVDQVLSETLRYTSRMAYDPAGNLVASTDAKGRSSQRFYDPLNRLIKEIDPNLGETTYSYDHRDNLLSVTDANGNTHSFTYDKLNRKLTEKRPMGQTITYVYDAIGQLKERISPNGAKRKYEYDADHRLTKETHFMPAQTTASKTITYDYYADGRGLLKSFDDGLTKSAYEYDKKGQRTKETITFGTGPTAIVKVIERTYEANGLLKTLKYPGSVGTQSYTYDTNNQHASTKIPGLAATNDTLAYTYRWNAIATTTMPGSLTRTVTLDPLQRPTKIEVKGTGNLGIPVLNHRYEYDAVSNITKKTTLDGEYQYGYDELDRLTNANPPDSLEQSPTSLPVERYNYDGVHNRTQSTHQPGAWAYNSNNELNTWGIGENKRVLTYDDNGSTTKEVVGNPASRTMDYVYDAQDRLVEVKNNNLTVAKYAYDPMGRRIWRDTFGADASTTWFLYSDEGLIGEYNQNGAAVREYGWSSGGLWGTDPVWQKDASGVYLAHNDHLFTTDKLTKSTDGRVSWNAVREAFGKTAVAADSQMTYLLRFPGQWADGVGGFSQNWKREYDTNVGRYMLFDPIGLSGGMNVFAYSLSSPTRYLDPFGTSVIGTWINAPRFNLVDFDYTGVSVLDFDQLSWSWWGYAKFIRIYGKVDGFVNVDVLCRGVCELWEIHDRLGVNIEGHFDTGINVYASVVKIVTGSWWLWGAANILAGGGAALDAELHFLKLADNKAGEIIKTLMVLGPTAICLGKRP